MEYLKSLKVHRKKAGFTQKEVEKELGLRSLTIKDYETGRLKLPLDMANRLAHLYEVDVTNLLNLQNSFTNKKVSSLSSLWEINFYQLIVFDPVIRADLEHNRELLSTSSLLDILIIDLSQSQRFEFVKTIATFINSLIGVDGKIDNSELSLRNSFLNKFDQVSLVKKLNKYLSEPYLPKNVPGSLQTASLKHFVIWLLFFIASADKEIGYQEHEYIENVAEAIRVTKINFEMIQSYFKKEF